MNKLNIETFINFHTQYTYSHRLGRPTFVWGCNHALRSSKMSPIEAFLELADYRCVRLFSSISIIFSQNINELKYINNLVKQFNKKKTRIENRKLSLQFLARMHILHMGHRRILTRNRLSSSVTKHILRQPASKLAPVIEDRRAPGKNGRPNGIKYLVPNFHFFEIVNASFQTMNQQGTPIGFHRKGLR